MPQTVTLPEQDELDQFVQSYKAQAATPKPSDDDDELDQFVKSYKAQTVAAPQPTSTIPLIPFRPPVTTQPLDQRAAQLDQPMIPMRPPMMDTSTVPLNVFENRPQASGMATVEESQRAGSLDVAPQTVTGRLARAIGAGSPQGSELANLTGQVGTKGDIGPRVQDLMTESEQQRHPVLTGAGEFASGMLSPEGVLLLAGTAGAGELAGSAGQTARQLMAAGFSAQMISDAVSIAPDISSAIQRGDSYTAKRLMTRAALTAGLGGLAGRGMFEGEAPPQAGYSQVADSDTLASRGKGMVGPANVPLTPESDATLKAQVDALSRGTNPIVYFPAGHETIPAPPENAQVTVVPDDQAGAGTYYHDDSITPQETKAAVKDGTYGKLLGNVQTKEEAIGSGTPEAGSAVPPVAVTARNDRNDEIQSSLVAGNDAKAQAEQSDNLTAKFPNAQVGVETPEQVIKGRKTVATTQPFDIKHSQVLPADYGKGKELVVQFNAKSSNPEQTVPEVNGKPAGAMELGAALFPDLDGKFDQNSRITYSNIAPAHRGRYTLRLRFPDAADADTALQKLGGFQNNIKLAGPREKNVTPQASRIAPTAPQTAASPETPQAGEADDDEIHEFVQQHREAADVIAPQKQELNGLASQVQHIDPHAADGLRGLAGGTYFSREDLLKIAGGVKNEEVAKNLKSIVDQFNARSGRETESSRAFVSEPRPEATATNANEGNPTPNSVPEDADSVRASAQGVRSLPRESGNQLAPNVGDTVQVRAGALKGSKLEVTKVGQTGVYVKGESGPIKFVKHGDFSVSPELTSGRTFFANPIGTALSEGSRILSRAWEQKVARPLIDRVAKIGDKYQDIREEDPAVAEGLHLLDNAPTYLREKAAQHVQDVVGNLSRPQERFFSLMADADSRENLRTNHPTEYRQAQNDPAIQQALRRYKPLEQELSGIRERLGGQNLDQDYLRRVYDKYVAGVNGRDAGGGSSETAPSDFDRVIRPQQVSTKSRQATAEYHYQNGLHEFGPAFGTKYIATHLKGLRDEVAQEFLSKATQVPHGSPEPASITYEGRRYYRPDLAREASESGRKEVKAYGVYNPTEGERFPVPSEGKFIGPKSVVDTLRNYGGKEASAPGALHRFFQEQILGFGFGVPHAFNILRRVTQTTAGGAANPVAWVRALKVGLSKNLRARGINGLDDPTFDMLAQHGAISTREVSNLKSYIGGNLNPANWMRGIAQVGHKALFDPKSFGGFGGLDQRARLYVADLMRSQRPDLSDAEIARGVGDALGEYGRANWTDRQKMLGRFMMFPGWDFSSFRWVVQHPIKTTLPPAILTLLANRALHSVGQNHGDDQNDLSAVHIGDRAYNTSLLRESMARNLFRPAINYAQAKLAGKSNAAALDEAGRGLTQGAGGLLNTLRPDLSGFVALATNRENIASGKEIVEKGDYNTPGKILPSRALEKQAAFAVRRAFPAFDRVLDQKGDVDLRSFVGGNLGVPNYRQSAEDRLNRNAAEAQRVMQTVNKLSKSDHAAARSFLKDPDNAALALFHNDISSLEGNLKRIDKAKAQVEGSNLADSVKAHRLQALDRTRQNVLSHADGLDQKLFDRRAAAKRSSGLVPMVAPGTY